MGPLEGIRVVEIEGYGPCPMAGMVFADLGADVILVERLGVNPNAPKVEFSAGNAANFHKRGKRSIALDLKNPAHVAVFLELVVGANMLIEGFRPGVVERLGIGPDACFARNKKLIYGRVTGWGQTGPLAMTAGHDLNYAALSGSVHYTGMPGDIPWPPATVLGDSNGGMMAVLGMLAAYINAQRTGEGQVVDAAMGDGAIYNMTLMATLLAQGALGEERGSDFFTGATPWAQTYRCADGHYITVQAVEPAFYRQLIELCGLGGDPDFSEQNNPSLWPSAKKKMAERFAGKTRAEWSEIFADSDACVAPVLSVTEAAEHPHNRARQNFVEINGYVQPAPAPKFSETRPEIGTPPAFNQHKQEILQELNLSPDLLDT